VFVVAAVAAGKPVAHGLFARADFNSLVYVGLSMAAHASLIGAMAFFVPPLGLTDGEAMGRDQLYLIQQYLQAAADRETETRDDASASNADVREGGSGSAASGEEGAMGSPNTKQNGHRYAVAGPKDNPDPHIARAAAIHEAATFGTIGILFASGGGDPDAPTAPWARLDTSGRDPLSARGNMWGDTLGESFGMNGLGLFGVGEGGGKSGLGIGIGAVGTIGHGDGTGNGDGIGRGDGGIGRGTGHLRPEHQPKVPSARFGTLTLNGHLPPEVVQRIVRQNYGRFRLCYENGLRTNPSLQGRVAARFVIGRDGAVSSVTNGDSDLPNASVVQCVLRAYYDLTFPAPQGGIVSVVYPIVFSPGE